MITKRDFIKTTAAATGAVSVAGFIRPAMATAALVTTAPSLAPASIAAVVYDGRLAHSRAFAFEFAQRGIAPLNASGGIVGLWNGPLRAIFDEQPKARIGGMTTADDFAILQKLGAAQSLATLYEGSHEFEAGRMTTKIVHAGPRVHDFAWMLREAGADWPPTLAHAILTAPLKGPGRQTDSIVTLRAKTLQNAGPVMSWVVG
jgi:hypothetical protein